MLLKKIYQFTKKQPKIKIHAGLHNKQLLAPQAM